MFSFLRKDVVKLLVKKAFIHVSKAWERELGAGVPDYISARRARVLDVNLISGPLVNVRYQNSPYRADLRHDRGDLG